MPSVIYIGDSLVTRTNLPLEKKKKERKKERKKSKGKYRQTELVEEEDPENT